MASEKANLFNDLTGRTERAQRAHESATEAAHSAEKNLARMTADAKSALKDSSDNVQQARAQAAEYDAENQAAQQGGPISIAEALALIEQEAKANEKAREVMGDHLALSGQYAGAMLLQGGTLVVENLDALGVGLVEGVTSKGGIASIAASMAIGTGVGAVVKNETMQNMMIDGIEAFTGLSSDNPSEEDEKFIGGVTTPEEQAAYIAENGNGEPNDPYAASQDGSVPDATEEKSVPDPDGHKTPEGVDALNASDEELNRLSDLDQVTSGEALGGPNLNSWLDSVAAMFDEAKKDNPEAGASELAGAVVEHVLPEGIGTVAAAMVEHVAPTAGSKLEQLFQMKDETDRNEAAKQVGDNEPGYSV